MPALMPAAAVTYLTHEQHCAIGLLGVALLSFAACVLLVRSRPRYAAGAWPLALFGIGHFCAAGFLLWRADALTVTLIEQYQSDPAAFRNGELARMWAVLERLKIYTATSAGLVSTAALVVLFARKQAAVLAVGVVFCVQGVGIFALHLALKSMAADYVRALLALVVQEVG